MSSLSSKEHLKEKLCRKVKEDLDAAEQAHRTTMKGATHEEAKPENDKDTRALEQSYLARGQARRVDEMRAALAEVQAMGLRAFGKGDRIALSALVTVDDEDAGQIVYFIAPEGGGESLACDGKDGKEAVVVTPKSPLGRALIGKLVGDTVEVRVGTRTREMAIAEVE